MTAQQYPRFKIFSVKCRKSEKNEQFEGNGVPGSFQSCKRIDCSLPKIKEAGLFPGSFEIKMEIGYLLIS
jgi:hypothetical protein